jgi:hypothetical protein
MEPLVKIIRVHQKPGMRIAVMKAIGEAIQTAPLDYPELLVALDTAANDVDSEVARVAREVAGRYRSQRRDAAENAVERLGRMPFAPVTLRMLAVRRFSCRASTAEGLLRELAADDPVLSESVQRAISLRRDRCQSVPHSLRPDLR